MSAAPLRICIVYDRLYPASIGGAERWYRLLATRLAEDGQHVTYLTTRHWSPGETPALDGVAVVPLVRQQDIYRRGRRDMLPVLQFGAAVARHLLRHGRKYDAVQVSAMSSWAALAVLACARRGGYRAVLDWWEVWPYRYWREYLGPVAALAGRAVQRLIARWPHYPVVYSELHSQRLRALRGIADAALLRGLLPPSGPPTSPAPASPVVLSVGRLIPEKQVSALVPALVLARESVADLRGIIIGEGPVAPAVQRSLRESALVEDVVVPGFVAEEDLQEVLRNALCHVLLSRREGYGLVVAEAAALGVPSVVLKHPDSAAAELIVDGVNGVICKSTDPADVASAILRVHDAGHALRLSTLAWYRANASELTIEATLPRLLAIYRGNASPWRPARPSREPR